MTGKHVQEQGQLNLTDDQIEAANAFMLQLRKPVYAVAGKVVIDSLDAVLTDTSTNKAIGYIGYDGFTLSFTPAGER